jgi:hypothetical protein
MKLHCVIGILLATLTCSGSARLSAQNAAPFDWHPYLIPNGETVYDVGNSVTWPAGLCLTVRNFDSAFRCATPL